MDPVVLNVTVNADQQLTGRLNPRTADGNITTVDPTGLANITATSGGGNVVIDPRGSGDNLDLIIKPDTTLAPDAQGNTTVTATIDVDRGAGIENMDITINILTVPANAATVTLDTVNSEPLGSEVTPPTP